MTLVFACLHNDLYTVANLQNLHVLQYHSNDRRLPFAALVRQDVGLFSEEAGEVAFSLLARSTLGDSVEDKHRRLTECFRAIGAIKPIHDEHLHADPNADRHRPRTTISPDDEEVLALEQHFLGVLRAFSDGSFSYYSSVDALKRSNRLQGLRTDAPKERLVLDSEKQIQRVWKKVSDLDRDWGQQFADRAGFDISQGNDDDAAVASGHVHAEPVLTPASKSGIRRKTQQEPSVGGVPSKTSRLRAASPRTSQGSNT